MSKLQITNLVDLETYRPACPFCNSELKLLCKNSIVSSSLLSQVSIQNTKDHYILTYDSNSAFCTVINSYIERILINKHTNDVTFIERNDSLFPSSAKNAALSSNHLNFVRSCDCVYDYTLITSVINLTNVLNVSFSPSIFSESFCIDSQNAPMTFIKFNNIYHSNITKMSCYDLGSPISSHFTLSYEKNLPLIKFPYHDIDELLKKVQLLMTFS